MTTGLARQFAFLREMGEELEKPNPYIEAVDKIEDAINDARAEADRAWVVLDWLAENTPTALELCPYKAKR